MRQVSIAQRHCSAGGMTSRCQMYSPSTRRMFFAPHSAARSMNALQRCTWKARTGSLKSIRPAATTGSETMGRLFLWANGHGFGEDVHAIEADAGDVLEADCGVHTGLAERAVDDAKFH